MEMSTRCSAGPLEGSVLGDEMAFGLGAVGKPWGLIKEPRLPPAPSPEAGDDEIPRK